MKKQWQEIRDRCFDESATFQAKQGMDYAWIWEYSMQRYRWVVEAIAKAEQKALNFLKFLAGLAAAVWTLSGFLWHSAAKLHFTETLWPQTLGGSGALLLAAATLLCVLAVLPGSAIQPYAENTAVKVCDYSSTSDEAKVKFALGFAAATEIGLVRMNGKSNKLLWAAWLTASGVALLLVSVSLLLIVGR